MNVPEKQIAEAPSTAPEIAPFALLRVAAVPYQELLDLAPPRVTALVETILAAEREMEAANGPLVDALFAAVKTAPDKRTRNLIVELKRDVHNGRARVLSAEKRDAVALALDEPARGALLAWTGAAAAVVERGAELDAVFADDVVRHTRVRLRAIADGDAFGRALAISSRDLHGRLAAERTALPAGPTSSKSERSLLGYVIRAAAKTSPFSTFMHVAPVTIDPSAAVTPRTPGSGATGATLPLKGKRRASRIAANRGIVAFLRRAVVDLARARAGAPLSLGESLQISPDGSTDALVSVHVVMRDKPWRDDQVAKLRFHPTVAAALARLPARFDLATLRDGLVAAGIEGAAADRLLAKLLDRGVLRLAAAIDGYDEDPAIQLAEDARSTPAVPPEVITLTSSLATLQADLTVPGDERRRVLDRLDRELAAACKVIEQPAPALRNLAFEDGVFSEHAGELPPIARELLAELAATMRPLVRMSASYAGIRDFFVERHGVGGRCDDVMGFAQAAVSRIVYGVSTVPELPHPDVKAGLTIFCQLSLHDVGRPDALAAPVVVNRAYRGTGWLTARRAVGSTPAHDAIARELGNWLARSSAPAEPVDLMLCGDCNDLQAHPRVTRRVLVVPPEPIRPGTDGVLGVGDLLLEHDPRTHLLRFRDRAGTLIAPVYLGNAAPFPGWGAKFVLTQLAQPFDLARPSMRPPPEGVDAEHRPAIIEGRVQRTRDTWWVKTSRVRERWLARTGARRLLDVARERHALGLPGRFFVSPAVPPSMEVRAIPDDILKPLWVDVTNPFSLDLVERTIGWSEWLVMTDVFPDANGMWARIDGERHVSELAVEVLV